MKESYFNENHNSDSDNNNDDDDEYTREKNSKYKTISSHSTNNKDRMSKTQKDNDSDIEDEEDDLLEMQELMQNFVAPSNNSSSSSRNSINNSNNLSSSNGNSGKLLNKSNTYKGQSSYTSNSIKYGAAGIRGIQHQSLHREQGKEEIPSSVTSISTVYTTNNSKLMNIKPGQAIRVKAPNKKSRSNHITNTTTVNT